MQMKKTQKWNDGCFTYLEGCVDICWRMVLAEPPLHIDFNIKQGDKFDPNQHSAYSHSGETVKFLVWPPLYNALEGGDMLSKGTVVTERKILKQKK
ncbi:hypothetical protein DPMN_116831 [Dreissena polymorpha]|uniref:Mitochondria-eating protein C-terminal domain-containing protein n=1 Tax=Dreissena polymorpha TaxID=45954 RepID=A0A9D4QUM0_DREPO|nr:hypothetical protein DPMN_116831 [Dreissena polymorpha]